MGESEAKAAVAAIDPSGERVFGVVMDVASSASVNSGVKSVGDHFGRIDVLVNNAGNFRQGDTATYLDEDWDRILGVHLDGAFRCARATYPYLKASGKGAIVSISSIVAHIALPGRASYAAAKAGIEALTRTLALEWARDGIRANAVAPGFTESRNMGDLEKKGLTTEARLLAAIPMGRFAKTSEQAEVIFFLGSEHSSFVTGQVIIVDGGTTLDIRI
ncbi:MAG: SDR family oxidoreductase [Actinobacteria bacterium]|nr:SDR family oxidoreductase [Actinomycetota bacterium]